MRVCDWIANFFVERGISRVHGIMGGGAAGLNDGFIKNGKIDYICYHHEQGAAHAAMGEALYSGKVAVVNPTTGCAGTNCATSVLDAWQDSVPLFVLSGNVRLNTCSRWINKKRGLSLRKYGIQEHDVIKTFSTITKFSSFITKVDDVAKTIQQAYFEATNVRPGPVWIDIPGDIQTANMPDQYEEFYPQLVVETNSGLEQIKVDIDFAKRPVVLVGQGIRQSNTQKQFKAFVEKYNIPFVTTYGAIDYIEYEHDLNMGSVGIKGTRYGNFVLQNADLLLILGSSVNSSVVGYDPNQFSIGSKKIIVDCDEQELYKNIIKVDNKYNINLKQFFNYML